MLVLSRKKDEQVFGVLNRETLENLLRNCPPEGHRIGITVVEIRGDKARLGFEAPQCVPVHRKEVYDAIQKAGSSLVIGQRA